MINQLYKKYTILLLVLALGSSCTKLDLSPSDTISPDKAFRNINDINMGILGVYALVDYSMISLSTTVSDEATFPVENSVGNNDAFRWLYNASSGSVTSLYNDYYKAIDRANRTMAGIDALTFTGADVATANRYRGELLALRGFLHFELLRCYAEAYRAGAMGVPYMKKSSIGYPGRDNFEVVMAAAKDDFIAAKALIPSTFTDKIRVTKLAVAAMQARLSLYDKNWGDAITYSTEVINGVPLATKAQFPGIWKDANDNEVIWKLKRTTTTDSNLGGLFYRQSGGIVLYAPAFKLIATYDQANDIRYAAYVKYDPTRTGTKSQYLVNKYIGNGVTPGLTDIKMFRTAEMYLIRAEAEAESTGDAAGDLNALRAARINGYVNATFADKTALIDAVYSERYKELALEGHRFFDLKRRNLSIERLDADTIGSGSARILKPTAAQYALPIPATEISVNKNTLQNPNY